MAPATTMSSRPSGTCAIEEAGKLRSEGRAYVMQDGDVVHFLFNV